MKTTLPGASQVSRGECEASPTLNSGNTLIKGFGIRCYLFFHINVAVISAKNPFDAHNSRKIGIWLLFHVSLLIIHYEVCTGILSGRNKA